MSLTVSGLHVHYGAIEAVKGIDLTLVQGRITTLLGANGAGKSTTLLTLSGLLRSSAGSIVFEGAELTRLSPHQIVELGLIQVPEGREILTTLSVRNLLLGAYRAATIEPISKRISLFRAEGKLMAPRKPLRGERLCLRRRRALMSRPIALLLLDEPSIGLAPC